MTGMTPLPGLSQNGQKRLEDEVQAVIKAGWDGGFLNWATAEVIIRCRASVADEIRAFRDDDSQTGWAETMDTRRTLTHLADRIAPPTSGPLSAVDLGGVE
jgi:hypothetical protein